MAWLFKVVEDADFSEEEFDELCEVAGATDKLMTKDQLYAVLNEGGAEFFREALYKLRALQTKVWWQISMAFSFAPKATHTHTYTCKERRMHWKFLEWKFTELPGNFQPIKSIPMEICCALCAMCNAIPLLW